MSKTKKQLEADNDRLSALNDMLLAMLKGSRDDLTRRVEQAEHHMAMKELP